MNNIEKDKKRIGIVTMYYNSANYGGLLQAYALARYLNENGYDSKQITYDFSKSTINVNSPQKKGLSKTLLIIKKTIKRNINEVNNNLHGMRNLKKIRRDACKCFRDSIPHTDVVYTVDTLPKTNDEFDVFISGSDQVWNPNGYRSGFFLTFVDNSKKKKIAYAASVSNHISPSAFGIYKEKLQSFDIISVREKSDVLQIKQITSNTVHWAVDPVFLLSKEEWYPVARDTDDLISEPYVFCYFLGSSIEQRAIASSYSSFKGWKIVTIPYMQMNYRKCDKKFGDVKVLDATPNQFLGLIKNAQCVFTDSFHATAFSIIFQKKFVVFERNGHHEMIERIKSITHLFNCEDNLIDENTVTLEHLDNILDETHSRNGIEEFSKLLAESKKILEI